MKKIKHNIDINLTLSLVLFIRFINIYIFESNKFTKVTYIL